jgi:uncharacterized protein (TIGR01777 family)
MRVVVAGGSGSIGKKLIQELLCKNFQVTILTRAPEKTRVLFPAASVVRWSGSVHDKVRSIVADAGAVINLSGAPIDTKRWTLKQKVEIARSRIESTRSLATALRSMPHTQATFINASAAGFYGDMNDTEVTESFLQGTGFLASLCAQWEAEALAARQTGARVVLLRTGVVLDTSSGALKKLLTLFQYYLGGTAGPGRQWFPWIHALDEVRAIIFALEHDSLEGPVNLAAPGIVRAKDLSSELGAILHRPSGLRMPSMLLRIALGEMAGLVLQGQRIVPARLLNAGFAFQFPELQNALKNLLFTEEEFGNG